MAAELEDASAEEALALGARDLQPAHVHRLLVPEDELGDRAHGALDQPRGALLLPRHRRALPGDLRDQGPARGALRDQLPPLQLDHPRAAGRASTATSSGAATPTPAAGSARSSRCARRSPRSTAGSPGSAARTRRPAPAPPSSPGTSASASGSSTRSPTGRRSRSGPTSDEHDIPYNPLHDQGYPSIGCTHCTRKPARGRGRARGPLGRAREDRVRPARLSVAGYRFRRFADPRPNPPSRSS